MVRQLHQARLGVKQLDKFRSRAKFPCVLVLSIVMQKHPVSVHSCAEFSRYCLCCHVRIIPCLFMRCRAELSYFSRCRVKLSGDCCCREELAYPVFLRCRAEFSRVFALSCKLFRVFALSCKLFRICALSRRVTYCPCVVFLLDLVCTLSGRIILSSCTVTLVCATESIGNQFFCFRFFKQGPVAFLGAMFHSRRLSVS